MKRIEIVPLLLQLFWAIITAFFKAFIKLTELNTIKERIIAAGLGIPIQVLTVATLLITAIKIITKIIKKCNL